MILKGWGWCFGADHSSTHSRFSSLMTVSLSFEFTSSMKENILSGCQVNQFGTSVRIHSLKPQQSSWGGLLNSLHSLGVFKKTLWLVWATIGPWASCWEFWCTTIFSWTTRLLKEFCIYKEKCLYPRWWSLPCLYHWVRMKRNENIVRLKRMGGVASFWPECSFGSQCLGIFGPHQTPGSLKEFHLFCSPNRKDKSSPGDISLWEFEIVF